MNKNKLAALVAGAALAAVAAGCSDTANTNTANANAANVNSNTAVVVNNNGNANSSGVSSTNANLANANTRRTYNANITKEEYDKDKDRYSKEAKDAGDTVGTGISDGWLWVKAKAALAAEDDLRDSTINVDVNNSIVTLRGDVASNDQVKKADAVTKKLDGVKSVVNKLKVAAGGGNTNANKAANANKS